MNDEWCTVHKYTDDTLVYFPSHLLYLYVLQIHSPVLLIKIKMYRVWLVSLLTYALHFVQFVDFHGSLKESFVKGDKIQSCSVIFTLCDIFLHFPSTPLCSETVSVSQVQPWTPCPVHLNILQLSHPQFFLPNCNFFPSPHPCHSLHTFPSLNHFICISTFLLELLVLYYILLMSLLFVRNFSNGKTKFSKTQILLKLWKKCGTLFKMSAAIHPIWWLLFKSLSKSFSTMLVMDQQIHSIFIFPTSHLKI